MLGHGTRCRPSICQKGAPRRTAYCAVIDPNKPALPYFHPPLGTCGTFDIHKHLQIKENWPGAASYCDSDVAVMLRPGTQNFPGSHETHRSGIRQFGIVRNRKADQIFHGGLVVSACKCIAGTGGIQSGIDNPVVGTSRYVSCCGGVISRIESHLFSN